MQLSVTQMLENGLAGAVKRYVWQSDDFANCLGQVANVTCNLPPATFTTTV